MADTSGRAYGDSGAVLYTEAGCRFCAAAKTLLALREFEYLELDVTDDEPARHRLMERGGRATLPQLFVGEELVGGFDEILALDRSGGLQQLVARSSISPTKASETGPIT